MAYYPAASQKFNGKAYRSILSILRGWTMHDRPAAERKVSRARTILNTMYPGEQKRTAQFTIDEVDNGLDRVFGRG